MMLEVGVMSEFDVEAVNDNERNWLDMCRDNSMYVRNTYFKHKRVHTYLWYTYAHKNKWGYVCKKFDRLIEFTGTKENA